ncbi:MAG: hypothetical protein HY710_02610 [Candidatus Latescibacteria bacterium]|nr:hypothetical protein [Candidatus Latescibacterota bacterium]
MDESPRFKLVFAKLRAVLADEVRKEPAKIRVEIRRPPEVTQEELDEIDNLRRIVLEVTEPEPMSFTTT